MRSFLEISNQNETVSIGFLTCPSQGWDWIKLRHAQFDFQGTWMRRARSRWKNQNCKMRFWFSKAHSAPLILPDQNDIVTFWFLRPYPHQCKISLPICNTRLHHRYSTRHTSFWHRRLRPWLTLINCSSVSVRMIVFRPTFSTGSLPHSTSALSG